MIQTKELLLGNYVKDGIYGFPMYVCALGDDWVYLDFNGNEGDIWECDDKDLEPITITDELLLKFGFEQCDYLFKTHLIEMYEVANGWHLHIDNERFETVLSTTIKYVHQLQNAYYISTGEILKIQF